MWYLTSAFILGSSNYPVLYHLSLYSLAAVPDAHKNPTGLGHAQISDKLKSIMDQRKPALRTVFDDLNLVLADDDLHSKIGVFQVDPLGGRTEINIWRTDGVNELEELLNPDSMLLIKFRNANGDSVPFEFPPMRNLR